MKSLFLAAIFVTTPAFAQKFNLPVELQCEGKTVYARGAYICAQKEVPRFLRVKIPPTKGQLRAVDCNEDLTDDKNPDDFNMKIERDGWWIFSRAVRVLDSTPRFNIPARSYNDCAIFVSVAGEKTGVQSALIVYDDRMSGTFLEMVCGSQAVYAPVNKVASCQALEGARLAFRYKPKVGVGLAHASGCGLTQRLDLTKEQTFEVRVPPGHCEIDFAWVTADKSEKTRVLVVGDKRESRELDSPLMVKEGNGYRVYKPNSATIISTEVYDGERVVFRSGVRDNESYSLTPGSDGPNPWPASGVACHTAYSDTLNSMSSVCYQVSTMRETPYVFK